ncbi:ATP-binding protein [Olsenella sp. DNF00959]|uniref:ATP-binding protein n=1 Tax=Olsenella sp. DNF00959 TaxID=1476999 RepID=UPI000780CD5D|nr:ATP-binding protein [Olsenella sp. DNF00959]KXB63527.1 hypothetical protein HMPREF1868_00611 [Olsenella sp. DNF00959]
MSRSIPFFGREKELAALDAEYQSGSSFVVIYGRRRVGKTALIKQFIQDKPSLYFLASKEDEVLNRRHFAQTAARFTENRLLADASFDDWRPLFGAIADAMSGRPYVLAIDEFPYLIGANKAMPSIMQYVWDELLSSTGCTLILCGSSVSMMRDQVLSRTSPLYGRRTSQMRLRPLAFQELREAFPRSSYESVVRSYAITNGVPKYLELFSPDQDFEESIRRNVLSTYGFLYEEPEFLLGEETRGTASYLSILSGVAAGSRKTSELARFLGRKAQEITPYLRPLMSLGFLERRVPFNERYPERSKNGLYEVSDSFLRFWLTYVQPFRGELEMGNMRPSLEAMGRSFQSKFVPFEFERICAEDLARLCLEGRVGITPSRIGGYWNRTGSLELDVCAQDGGGAKAFLGECKYYVSKPVGMDEYRRLAAKAETFAASYDDGVLLGLFSHTGFSDELKDLAGERDDLILVDKGEVV